jgi:nicotinate-nucleotide adenylyltransferase
MTALAVRQHPRFEVSDVEMMRPGPSFTVDTLASLSSRGDLHLLIGSETFLDLPNWRDPRKVVNLARLVVVPRSGAGFAEDASASQRVLAELDLPGFVRPDCDGEREADSAAKVRPRAPLLVHASSLPISASDLRRRARDCRSLAYRLPESVAAYIREHNLYRDPR